MTYTCLQIYIYVFSYLTFLETFIIVLLFFFFCLHCYSHSLLLRDHLRKHQENVNRFFFFCNLVLKKYFLDLLIKVCL